MENDCLCRWGLKLLLFRILNFDVNYKITYISFDPNSKATLLVGGFEIPTGKYFTFTPNIIPILCDTIDDGYKTTTDLSYRLTIFFKI